MNETIKFTSVLGLKTTQEGIKYRTDISKEALLQKTFRRLTMKTFNNEAKMFQSLKAVETSFHGYGSKSTANCL